MRIFGVIQRNGAGKAVMKGPLLVHILLIPVVFCLSEYNLAWRGVVPVIECADHSFSQSALPKEATYV